jgi:hypothetical protein
VSEVQDLAGAAASGDCGRSSTPAAPRVRAIMRREANRGFLASDQPKEVPVPPSDVSRRRYSASRLLFDTHGDFIETTFWRLLKRPPDAAGYRYFLGRLQRGKSPIRVLAEIAQSSEARGQGTRVRKWTLGVLTYLVHAAFTGRDRSPARRTNRSEFYLRDAHRAIEPGPTAWRPKNDSESDKYLAHYAWQLSRREDNQIRRVPFQGPALDAVMETLEAQHVDFGRPLPPGRAGAAVIPAGTIPLVVDVGAGLGMWLDALAAHGIAGLGIESNATAIGYCRRKGHQVVYAEPTAYLASKLLGEIAVVTAFDFDVRVGAERMADFFDAVGRAIAPRGLLLLTLAGGSVSVPLGFPLPRQFFRFLDFARYLSHEVGFDEERMSADAIDGPTMLLAFRKRSA